MIPQKGPTMRMHPGSAFPPFIAQLFSLGGCSNETPTNATHANAAAAVREASPVAPAAKTAPAAPASPPTPGRILADIYGQKGDGSASYALDDGDVVEFWHGERFELSGKSYYTGFADHVSKAALDNAYPEPDMGVGITQATYVADTVDGKPAWKPFRTQTDMGSFGAFAKADQIDPARATRRYRTKAGHLVMAIPTIRPTDGVKSGGFAILLFDPAKGMYQGWQYMGTVPAGEDNGASCDDEGTVKCAVSRSKLTFVAPKSGTIPTLRVTMQGTAIAGPGRIRTLGAGDTKTYIYDNQIRTYQPRLLDR